MSTPRGAQPQRPVEILRVHIHHVAVDEEAHALAAQLVPRGNRRRLAASATAARIGAQHQRHLPLRNVAHLNRAQRPAVLLADDPGRLSRPQPLPDAVAFLLAIAVNQPHALDVHRPAPRLDAHGADVPVFRPQLEHARLRLRRLRRIGELPHGPHPFLGGGKWCGEHNAGTHQQAESKTLGNFHGSSSY